MKRITLPLLAFLLLFSACGLPQVKDMEWLDSSEEPVWIYNEEAAERYFLWNGKTELVVQSFPNELDDNYTTERLSARDIATGKTVWIAETSYCPEGGKTFRLEILSDTQILYKKIDLDGGPDEYYFYDHETGKSIRVADDPSRQDLYKWLFKNAPTLAERFLKQNTVQE